MNVLVCRMIIDLAYILISDIIVFNCLISKLYLASVSDGSLTRKLALLCRAEPLYIEIISFFRGRVPLTLCPRSALDNNIYVSRGGFIQFKLFVYSLV